MTNKNYTSIGKIVGACLDDYLYDNRKKETALKFSNRVGFSAKTISRWRTNGVTSLEGLDCVLQAMGKRVRVIIEDDDDSNFLFLNALKMGCIDTLRVLMDTWWEYALKCLDGCFFMW